MIQPIDPEDIRKLIDAHGKRESITICMEEAAEYIQALSKMLRTTDWEAGTSSAERHSSKKQQTS